MLSVAEYLCEALQLIYVCSSKERLSQSDSSEWSPGVVFLTAPTGEATTTAVLLTQECMPMKPFQWKTFTVSIFNPCERNTDFKYGSICLYFNLNSGFFAHKWPKNINDFKCLLWIWTSVCYCQALSFGSSLNPHISNNTHCPWFTVLLADTL